ncbi:hypothetical protein ACIRRA_44960 [Nocardia sp. NPDC101769]|uniref:hypothetical protein n=1 Tax=Nocardia sp. NPDC101769 TaxID=3364333 RepID=UPI0037F8FBCC
MTYRGEVTGETSHGDYLHVTVMRVALAVLQFAAGAGMYHQLGSISAGTAVPGAVRAWATVTLFVLAAAAGAMTASVGLGRAAEHLGAHRSWNLSLLLQFAGMLALCVALMIAARTT